MAEYFVSPNVSPAPNASHAPTVYAAPAANAAPVNAAPNYVPMPHPVSPVYAKPAYGCSSLSPEAILVLFILLVLITRLCR